MTDKRKKEVVLFSILLVCSVCFILLDQYTKVLAVEFVKGKKDITVIQGTLSFDYVENKGMAWGMMSGQRTLFVVLTLILATLMLAALWRLIQMSQRKKKKVYLFLEADMVLLLAGALGNLWDRIKNGYVVDFLKFDFIDFPVFNLADCYVTVSVIILFILIMFFVEEKDLDELLSVRKKHDNRTGG